MNVKELDKSTTSIYAFIIMAIAIILLSYGVRLFIRSRALASMLETMMANVRTFSDTPEGNPVPTTTFLRWTGHTSYRPVARLFASLSDRDSRLRLALIIGIAAIWLLPLSSLWANKHLAAGMKTTISVAVTLPFLLSLIGSAIESVQYGITLFAKSQQVSNRQAQLLEDFFPPQTSEL